MRISKDVINYYVITLLIFLSFSFFFFDPFYSYGPIIKTALSWVCVITLITINGLPTKILFPGIIMFIYFLILNYGGFYTHNSDQTFSKLYFSGINILIIFLILQEKIDKSILLKAFDFIIKIFILLNIFSLIIYFLVLFSVPLPYEKINLGGRGFLYRNYYNLAIFCDYVMLYFKSFVFTRLNGMFEEPGMFGSYSGVLLAFDTLFFPNKRKRQLILLIFGLLSLSLAFYIMIILVYFYKSFNKTLKPLLYAIVSIVLIWTFIPKELKLGLNDRLISRFIISDGKFKGDSRESYYNIFEKYSKNASNLQLLIGNGLGTNSKNKEAQFSSFHGVIYEGGYTSFILLLFFFSYFFIYLPIKYQNYRYLFITIIPILSIYQGRSGIDFLTIIICLITEYLLIKENKLC